MKAKCPIGAMSLQLGAKKLAERGIDTGGHKIFKQLREIGMLNGLHPTLKAENMCWLEERRGVWERGGTNGEYCRVFITPSGLDQAERRLKELNIEHRTLNTEHRMDAIDRLVVHDIDLGVKRGVQLGF